MSMDHAPSIPDGNLSRRKLLSERCQTTSRCTIDGGRPFHAALTFDDTLKDDVGIVQGASAKSLLRSIRTQDSISYIALSGFTTEAISAEDRSWTLIPVQYHNSSPPSSQSLAIRVSPSSPSLYPLLRTIPCLRQHRKRSESKILGPQQRRPLSVLVYDVVPLGLETIYIELDHRSISSSFLENPGIGTEPATVIKNIEGQERRPVENLIRTALSSRNIIHSGSELSLSSPSDSINLTPPIARIIFCEPVAQGILSPKTRIIVLPESSSSRRNNGVTEQPRTAGLVGVEEKNVSEGKAEKEERPNDAFYSTGEQAENYGGFMPKGEDENSQTESISQRMQTTALDEKPNSSLCPPHGDIFGDDESADSDSESLPDIISLAPPDLPGQSHVPGTSQGVDQSSYRYHNQHSTGSVHPYNAMSTFHSNGETASLRHESTNNVFRTRGLLYPISLSMVHPPPHDSDDPESFVFVDALCLARIACFSGDLVRLEVRDDPDVKIEQNAGNVRDANSDAGFRVVKVYGLSGLSTGNRTSRSKRLRTGNSAASTHTAPLVLLSPVLLHNLRGPKLVSLAALPSPVATNKSGHVLSGVTSSPMASGSLPIATQMLRDTPPIAKEVTLHKISSPLSLDRALQPALFVALKRFFEEKLRIVKNGDLVAIRIDDNLGKIMFYGSGTGGGGSTDQAGQILDEFWTHESRLHRTTDVAWFRVTNVKLEVSGTPAKEACSPTLEALKWGGVAIIDISTTRMVTAGNVTGKLPSTTDNPWEYYLGRKAIPRVYVSAFVPLAPGPAAGANANTNNSLLLRGNDFLIPIHHQPRIHVSKTHQRMSDLIAASTSPQALRLKMAPVVILLTSNQRLTGKATTAQRACAGLGIHVLTIDAYDILTDGGAAGGADNSSGGDVKTETYLKVRAERALACGPEASAVLIRHIDVLTANRMVSVLKSIIEKSRVLIATTTKVDKVADGMRALFTHEMELLAPEEHERKETLEDIVNDMGVMLSPDVDLATIATKTAALVAGDLVDVASRAIIERRLRLQKLAQSATKQLPFSATEVNLRDIHLAGGPFAVCVTQSDFENAVDAARKNFADSIGAPKIPNVGWQDIGGLTHVKETIMETIQLPLDHPELFAHGMKKRSGILLYGPPGTGKTLVAKAIATEFSLNFFSVKGPELLNMYIGESEANVRRVFQRARNARPCVVFFDELDSVAPKRGNQGDSGGVMDRIVSQLLAELDGMSGDESAKSSDPNAAAATSSPSKGSGVFVVGATNRPDLLDAALLRPGRFDKMLYLGVPDTHEKQAAILSALTRKFALSPDAQLPRVADSLPLTYTGADLYALCSGAILKAITRATREVDAKIEELSSQGVTGAGGGSISTAWFFDHLASDEDVTVIVTEGDFFDAKAEQVSSVSEKELAHFDRIRAMFESQQM